MRPAILSLGLMLAATPALAQTAAPSTPPPSAASPLQHQMVVGLAYVLGESHALHRLCAGAADNTWRGRMGRLLKAEAPDPAYRQQLMNSFNAGFTAERAEFTTCTLKSADQERIVAAKGRDISRHLAVGVPP